ncbi:MAG TPA: CDP-alcohol phosphatidyltransferase family protein [Bacillota bacterium]|nr:CDP-alcohol phosphatidyltransferase family protein [Bacillota bacterium]HPL54564.1 CDP-alcohol phosphatidyltransferase family protein [Bacillota bacterium]
MNTPNVLTITRLLLIPGFVYYYFSPLENGDGIAVILFSIAGFTDILDGFIARRFNLVTRLGTVLDPLADKLMLFTVLASITMRGQIPFWIIAVVVIKETLLVLGAITLFNDHDIVVPANGYGKLSTIAFYTAIIAVALDMPYGRIMLYGFVMATVVALAVYINSYISIRRRQMDLIKK